MPTGLRRRWHHADPVLAIADCAQSMAAGGVQFVKYMPHLLNGAG